jgi:hypothetical protein
MRSGGRLAQAAVPANDDRVNSEPRVGVAAADAARGDVHAELQDSSQVRVHGRWKYVSVSSQADTEKADLEREQVNLLDIESAGKACSDLREPGLNDGCGRLRIS